MSYAPDWSGWPSTDSEDTEYDSSTDSETRSWHSSLNVDGVPTSIVHPTTFASYPALIDPYWRLPLVEAFTRLNPFFLPPATHITSANPTYNMLGMAIPVPHVNLGVPAANIGPPAYPASQQSGGSDFSPSDHAYAVQVPTPSFPGHEDHAPSLIEAKCTIAVGHGSECGVVLHYTDSDRQPLVDHLRLDHYVVHLKLPRRANGAQHILCPEITCMCRFKAKYCTERDERGRCVPHRTHVVDLLRHYMDAHLAPTVPHTDRYRCSHCEAGFTTERSRKRHLQTRNKKGYCPGTNDPSRP